MFDYGSQEWKCCAQCLTRRPGKALSEGVCADRTWCIAQRARILAG
jgi:hypothetical protein